MTDIRELGLLAHWNDDPAHPGYAYCYTTTSDPYRIHIARKDDFKVLGSFPSWVVANLTMLKVYDQQKSPVAG